MPTGYFTFTHIIQDAEDYNSFEKNTDYMVTQVFFDLEVEKKFYNMLVEVRHPFGSDYNKDLLEVGPWQGEYRGPRNHSIFAEEVEKYYRENEIIKSACSTVVRKRDKVRFTRPKTVSIQLPEGFRNLN